MSTLDHVTLVVSDYARAKSFYEKALAPLGIVMVMEFGQACGFGRPGKPDFWIGVGPDQTQARAPARHYPDARRVRGAQPRRSRRVLCRRARSGRQGLRSARATNALPPEILRRLRPRPRRPRHRGGLPRRVGVRSAGRGPRADSSSFG